MAVSINLARTFLAIVKAGDFVRAMKRLKIMRSAVSTRVLSLKEQLARAREAPMRTLRVDK
jgi:DNA-binding transcriptional LysR family regulator